ncbi:hypothetical protein L1787_05225 [Acuticoccus sp. M5D2P5]|uniref:hypothetical protein n=1 Tax=Acuticoccus kalidii TaxID=2910977 RepID=UPI001F4567AE|nr:hypothetical protein [Acuticoccus kalidii]MCF3932816.1 hypothetical protein [Acuticoccus kalidii]
MTAVIGTGGVHDEGAWPFVTLHHYVQDGRRVVWRERENRKGLRPAERRLEGVERPFWQGAAYNYLIGALFAGGACLFMLGSAFTLGAPTFGGPTREIINITFFLGSIPFTMAAYLQHFQAANATVFAVVPRDGRRRIAFIGWQPRNAGWVSTFTQFLGTVAFNFNTYDALTGPSGWMMQDLVVFLPGLVGSILFLVSGYIAFIEVAHTYWSWRPRDLDWRIVFVNLLGCIFFMTAGLLAYVPAGPEPAWIPVVATAHIGLGALGFFVGAVLLMHESRLAERHPAAEPLKST